MDRCPHTKLLALLSQRFAESLAKESRIPKRKTVRALCPDCLSPWTLSLANVSARMYGTRQLEADLPQPEGE